MDAHEFKFLTIKQAAAALGLPYWKVQRAVQRRQIPHYTLFNSRKLVLLAEILKIIQQAGAQSTPADLGLELSSEGTPQSSEEGCRRDVPKQRSGCS
jgi:excisionase family DNA binding protein